LPGSMAHFAPVNAAARLTKSAERFSKSKSCGSLNSIRTDNRLVNHSPQLAEGSVSAASGFLVRRVPIRSQSNSFCGRPRATISLVTLRNVCPETHGATELLAEIANFGTTQQDIERSIGPPALSG